MYALACFGPPTIPFAANLVLLCLLQDADAAVALNLFYSRITEQQESCAAVLSSLAAALPGAVVGLQDYEAVHRVADETASAARAAHQQVLEAQVHMTLLTRLLCRHGTTSLNTAKTAVEQCC